MGLPVAPITTGFSGVAEPSMAHDTASSRPQATTPSPSGIKSDAESFGTQTPASPQNDLGSDAASHYPLSDAAIISLQLRGIQGKSDDLDQKPKHVSRQANQPGDDMRNTAPQANPSTDQLLDLSSQESDLESALQSMGMSPGAIQEFIYIGQVLANAAPGLFQDFVAQVVNLADLYKQAQLPGFGSPATAGKGTKAQSELQMVSVEESQASVSVTQTSSGETLSVSAQEATLTFVNFDGSLNPGQPSSPASKANPRTAASQRSSASGVTASHHTRHNAPAD